jgi:hypothetical protein
VADEPTFNQVVATGQAYIDYDPINVLKEMQAAIGYNDGYVIRLGKDQSSYLFRRLVDTIAFHTGGDTPLKA